MPEHLNEAKFHSIQRGYIKRLKALITEISQLREILETGYMPSNGFNILFNLAHNFSGSGSTFGFPLITQTAQDLYDTLNVFIHSGSDKKDTPTDKTIIIQKLKLFEDACRDAAKQIVL
jgi:hypothetical protein